jgi:5'-nucleotidase
VLYVNGEQLKRMIKHILREEAFYGHTEFYQFSRGLRIEYDRKNKDLISLSYNGMEVMDSDEFKIALQDFHYQSMDEFLAVTHEEVQLPRAPKVISTNNTDMLEEFFRNREMIRVSEEKRLIIHE